MLPAAIQNIEALHFAVDSINNNPYILPHTKLGLDLFGLSSCAASIADQFANLTKVTNITVEPIVGLVGLESSHYTEEFFNQLMHSVVSIKYTSKLSA